METQESHEKVQLTYREYALLPDDGRRHELIDGDFFVTPAPNSFHQTVSRRLQRQLMNQLEDQGLALIFNAPFDVILADTSVVQPDLAVVGTNRRYLLSLRGLEGAPSVAVEILSPSNPTADLVLKRALYAKYSVPEYWIVDPVRGQITVHRSSAPGTPYDQVTRFERDAVLTSVELPEIAIPLAPLFAPL